MNPTDDISDKELSELYRDTSRERSPASLDRAVLEMAREHVQMHQTNTRLRRFTPRFAWAAVIVLSIGVVLSVELDNSSKLLDNARSPAELSQAPLNRSENLPGSDMRAAPAAKPKPRAMAKYKPKLKPMPVESETTTAADIPAQPSAEAEPSAAAELSAAAEPESQVAAPAQGVLAERRRDASEPISEKKLARQETIASEENIRRKSIDSLNKKPASRAQPLTAAPMPATPAPAPAPTASFARPAKKAPSASASRMTAAAPQGYADKAETADIGAGSSGRFSQDSETDSSKLSLASKMNQAAQLSNVAPSCPKLSPYACAVTPGCVLIKADSGLSCRAASNACERDFNQIEAKASSCTNTPGCRFSRGDCDCNKQSGQCLCNGTGPALCQPE